MNRPDILNRDAIVKSLVRQGVKESVARPLVSDLRLIVPILLRELGAERINEILERHRTDLGLREGFFWPQLTPHLVRWAEAELDACRVGDSRREADEACHPAETPETMALGESAIAPGTIDWPVEDFSDWGDPTGG